MAAAVEAPVNSRPARKARSIMRISVALTALPGRDADVMSQPAPLMIS
jgi:hypothetical protein